jgi:hypothetical protein
MTEQKQDWLSVCKIRSTKDKNFLSKVIIGHEMRIQFKGLRFEAIPEIKAEFQVVLGSITRRELQRCLQHWERCCDRCISSVGDAVAGGNTDL